MAKRRRSSLALSAEQARQALAVLIQEGKLAAGEVQKALQRRDRLIRALRDRLTALGEDAGRVGRRLLKGAVFSVGRKTGATKPRAKRRKPRISAATRKMYQAQGRYMAAVRQLPKAARAKIKAIRARSGVAAATVAAKKMAK